MILYTYSDWLLKPEAIGPGLGIGTGTPALPCYPSSLAPSVLSCPFKADRSKDCVPFTQFPIPVGYGAFSFWLPKLALPLLHYSGNPTDTETFFSKQKERFYNRRTTRVTYSRSTFRFAPLLDRQFHCYREFPFSRPIDVLLQLALPALYLLRGHI